MSTDTKYVNSNRLMPQMVSGRHDKGDNNRKKELTKNTGASQGQNTRRRQYRRNKITNDDKKSGCLRQNQKKGVDNNNNDVESTEVLTQNLKNLLLKSNQCVKKDDTCILEQLKSRDSAKSIYRNNEKSKQVNITVPPIGLISNSPVMKAAERIPNARSPSLPYAGLNPWHSLPLGSSYSNSYTYTPVTQNFDLSSAPPQVHGQEQGISAEAYPYGRNNFMSLPISPNSHEFHHFANSHGNLNNSPHIARNMIPKNYSHLNQEVMTTASSPPHSSSSSGSNVSSPSYNNYAYIGQKSNSNRSKESTIRSSTTTTNSFAGASFATDIPKLQDLPKPSFI
ncbi:hypothetical protein Kpol_423p5 [Vanderwaltozyma polyspora DSM 70294]|uniref:Uncharacterized protein n=1 Tax=Vanderwaltozyma polyspora (strain ATCC 22028 / DSM 70294 / BCRC 21397 / CBS 2163 / NBRC 10782 / NRRL Y-8283 / UCD 57-17) TaxID=436907 RepID=A7TR82_VANPO|nr:uncharacterized protein Kpol_423p5 [Vanderwaltozyma polyspora DSM 70294]EDO15215.1 hypothetical protein Kpol_423p5 [Vanderwaltozyma polyspora DSM 70294]